MGVILLVLFLGISAVTTQQINWTRMFYAQLKIPYGTYALKEITGDMFDDVQRNRNSILELTDTLTYPIDLFSVSDVFDATGLEVEKMLEQAENGSNFLISANYFSKKLLDTLELDLDTLNLFFGNQITAIMDEGEQADYRFSIKDFLIRDTVHIMATDPSFSKDFFTIKKRDVFTHLVDVNEDVEVLATYNSNPIMVKMNYGEGSFVISTVPHLFSNIYILLAEGHAYVSYMLSHASSQSLIWTEFYEIGRGLASTPLRYVLSQPALKGAIYTTLAGLLLLVVFEVKRKQRPIPIVNPLRNESLEFAQTIGNLYFEGGHNVSIARKRAQFFLEYLRSHYYMETRELDEQFVETLTRKSHSEKDHIKELTDQVKFVQQSATVRDELLKKFSDNLDRFYHYNTKSTADGKQ